jgi:hypothetical protein
MKLAYRMCSFYPELMDELKRTLEAMEIDYHIFMQNIPEIWYFLQLCIPLQHQNINY